MTTKEINLLSEYFMKRLDFLESEYVQMENELVQYPKDLDGITYLQMIENRAEYRQILVLRQDLYSLLGVIESLKKRRTRGCV